MEHQRIAWNNQHTCALQWFVVFFFIAKENQNSNDELTRLSSQLALEELWDTLSACLSELARTSDRNAVLVLQPAVEAFFLVHGTEKEDNQSNAAQQQQRGRQVEIARLASIRSIEDMPPSPGPTSPGGSLSPTLQTSFLADLPVDQQVFLRFAGKCISTLFHEFREDVNENLWKKLLYNFDCSFKWDNSFYVTFNII